jgi:NADH-quinone oxidoreductase subunit G/NADP-reducing hydrogenase subunit HndD
MKKAVKRIKVKINGKEIICREGQTILEVARENDIFIPSLCNHPDFPVKANCRICVAEIKGQNRLVTSCSTAVADKMEIRTDTEKVKKARNLNIELIFAEHIEKCASCVWRFECPLLELAERYKILITTFRDRKGKRSTYKFANAVEIDGSQCIDCRNCIDACGLLQNIHYLELDGKGHNQEVVPTKNKDIHCILCGQCAVHCPVSAAQEQTQYEEVEKILKNEKKIVVAQFAPSIRVSIGENFGLPYGKIVTGQIVSALKELGFDYVFDVNFGADITTIVEAEELLERIKKGGVLPMITSCCPAWVNYVEFYHSEIIPHLTTARSPHIHLGAIIKTYWARKMKIKPKDVVVVSVMPCTAKKYEAIRSELKVKGLYPVDYVLTTREFSFMLKKRFINLGDLPMQKADNPLGEHSSGAALYGGSGGVMEAALRAAAYKVSRGRNKLVNNRLEFKEVDGMKKVKEATVSLAGRRLRVAVVNGIGQIEPILANLDKYDYIEVMACPDGCIGGGGQPIPTTEEIRQKRLAALRRLSEKLPVRHSYANKEALEVVSWAHQQGQKFAHSIFHTNYKKKTKY